MWRGNGLFRTGVGESSCPLLLVLGCGIFHLGFNLFQHYDLTIYVFRMSSRSSVKSGTLAKESYKK